MSVPFVPGTVLTAADLHTALVVKRVRVATTAAGTLATSFENGDTVDGVVLATGDRILIKDQAAGAENGIYTVAGSGAPVRALDFDSSAEALSNTIVVISEGTTNADKIYMLTTNAPITLGSTTLTWTIVASATTATFYTEHTWAIPNPAVESGDSEFIIPMAVYVAAGETKSLAAARYKINSGTSVSFDLTKNGTNATGFTSLSATTTIALTDPSDVALADGDLIKPDISAVAGTPLNLMVTIVLKHVVTLS